MRLITRCTRQSDRAGGLAGLWVLWIEGAIMQRKKSASGAKSCLICGSHVHSHAASGPPQAMKTGPDPLPCRTLISTHEWPGHCPVLSILPMGPKKRRESHARCGKQTPWQQLTKKKTKKRAKNRTQVDPTHAKDRRWTDVSSAFPRSLVPSFPRAFVSRRGRWSGQRGAGQAAFCF